MPLGPSLAHDALTSIEFAVFGSVGTQPSRHSNAGMRTTIYQARNRRQNPHGSRLVATPMAIDRGHDDGTPARRTTTRALAQLDRPGSAGRPLALVFCAALRRP